MAHLLGVRLSLGLVVLRVLGRCLRLRRLLLQGCQLRLLLRGLLLGRGRLLLGGFGLILRLLRLGLSIVLRLGRRLHLCSWRRRLFLVTRTFSR